MGGDQGLSGAGGAESWPHSDCWNGKNTQPAKQSQSFTGHRIHRKFVMFNRMAEFLLRLCGCKKYAAAALHPLALAKTAARHKTNQASVKPRMAQGPGRHDLTLWRW
jgi:hypothetical protein